MLWENFTYVSDKNRQEGREEAWKDGRKEENEKERNRLTDLEFLN